MGSVRAAVPLPELPWDALDRAAEALLPPWHAAWARLMADALAARRLFPKRQFQPSFIAFGPPRTAKSLAVTFVCRSAGLSDGDDAVLLSAVAPGELGVRRVPTGGGGYRLERSPLIDRSLLCLDEFGSADAGLRREALKLLQGNPELVIEGHRVHIRPVPVVLFNPPDRAGPLPLLTRAIYRRSFALDTGTVNASLPAFEAGFADFMDAPAPRLLDLDRLVAGHEALPRGVRELLAEQRGNPSPLTDAGKEFWDDPELELCALGRASRWQLAPDADPRAAAAAVMLDALTCAETIPGLVDPTWRDDLAKLTPAWREYLGGTPGGALFLDTVSRAEQSRRAIRDGVAVARRESIVVDLELDRKRAEATERLIGVRKTILQVPEPFKSKAAGIRAVLTTMLKRAGEIRSMQALDELVEAVAPAVADAEELRQRIDTEKGRRGIEDAQRSQQREAARQAATADRKREKAEMAEAKRRQTSDIRMLNRRRQALVKLEARKRTLSDVEVFQMLAGAGVVQLHVTEREEAVAPGPIARFRKQPSEPRFRTIREQTVEDFVGALWRPSQLRTWSDPAVRQILDLAIAEFDRRIAIVRAQAIGWPSIASAPLLGVGASQPAALPPGSQGDPSEWW
jgi:hypothetical protein